MCSVKVSEKFPSKSAPFGSEVLLSNYIGTSDKY